MPSNTCKDFGSKKPVFCFVNEFPLGWIECSSKIYIFHFFNSLMFILKDEIISMNSKTKSFRLFGQKTK